MKKKGDGKKDKNIIYIYKKKKRKKKKKNSKIVKIIKLQIDKPFK
jgi:hypothetical protein